MKALFLHDKPPQLPQPVLPEDEQRRSLGLVDVLRVEHAAKDGAGDYLLAELPVPVLGVLYYLCV